MGRKLYLIFIFFSLLYLSGCDDFLKIMNNNSQTTSTELLNNVPVFSEIPAYLAIEYGTNLDMLSLGLKAHDIEDGDLTNNIACDVKDTSTLKVGTHKVTYTVIDKDKNKETLTVTLIVKDTTKPIFSNIPTNQIIKYGTRLNLLNLGLTASDNVDGDLTNSITVDRKYTSSLAVGKHTITYSVKDTAGNEESTYLTIIVYSDTTDAKYFTLNSDGDTIIDYDVRGGDVVVIPQYINGNLITTIGKDAFSGKFISNIVIPDGVTAIEDRAFAENRINNIIIPKSVTTIGDYAFYSNSLYDVTIPESVNSIGINAFDYFNLNRFNISEDNPKYKLENNLLMTKDNLTLIAQIGWRSNVTIPESITTIGDYAFYNTSLKNVIISENVTKIGKYAFFGNFIESVMIPDNVTTIGINAFDYYKLKSLVISENNSKYRLENNFLLTKDNLTLVALIGKHNSVSIPDGITTIGNFAFYNNKLTSVIIPNTVKTIGDSAFIENNLSSLELPNSVTTIGSSAFTNNLLTSLTIPDSVTTIKDHAFSGNKLENVVISKNITTIGNNAFHSNNLTSVIIPDGVKIIEEGAFSNNHLTSVIIPEGVKIIEYKAFHDNNLKNIIIKWDNTRFNDEWLEIGFPIELKP